MGEHGVSLENMGNMENMENMEKMENINQMTQKSPADFWRKKQAYFWRYSLHVCWREAKNSFFYASPDGLMQLYQSRLLINHPHGQNEV